MMDLIFELRLLFAEYLLWFVFKIAPNKSILRIRITEYLRESMEETKNKYKL